MNTKRSLQIRGLSRSGISYLRLYGTIDDTFDSKEFLEAANGRHVIINLKAVTRLSSFGVREWVHVLQALTSRVDKVALVECSPATVSQINMVANFSASAQVLSVQLPYFCAGCSWDTEVTCELDRDMRNEFASLPPVKCKRCGKDMSFDDSPETYFAFQQSSAPKPADPELASFIRDFAVAAENADGTPVPSGSGPITPPVVSNSGPSQALNPFIPSAPNAALPAADVAPMPGPARTPMDLLRDRRVQIGVGALALVLVVALATSGGDEKPAAAPSVAAESPLAKLDAAVAGGDLTQAEAQLKAADAALSEEQRAAYRAKIGTLRDKASSEQRRSAVDSFRRGDHQAAVAAALEADKLAPLDAETLFILAESLRMSGRRAQAVSYYGDFVSRFPEEPRVDQAMYWQADGLSVERPNEAREIYRQLMKQFPKSPLKAKAKLALTKKKRR